jgi:hypothetical protein
MTEERTATDIVNGLGARWSPNFDAYEAGEIPLSQVVCVLCQTAPCSCPPFGSDEYFALLHRVHGK